jgi:hypothetical protein
MFNFVPQSKPVQLKIAFSDLSRGLSVVPKELELRNNGKSVHCSRDMFDACIDLASCQVELDPQNGNAFLEEIIGSCPLIEQRRQLKRRLFTSTQPLPDPVSNPNQLLTSEAQTIPTESDASLIPVQGVREDLQTVSHAPRPLIVSARWRSHEFDEVANLVTLAQFTDSAIVAPVGEILKRVANNSWDRYNDQVQPSDCEIVRGYIFITKCIKYCHSHILGYDEFPPYYVGFSVV